MKWQEFRKKRLKELMDGGMTFGDASKVISREWKAMKEGKPSKGASVSSKSSKTALSIKYITSTSGELSEEQAKDIALGMLDGLIEYADGDSSTELTSMQRRAAELFRGEERTASDTAERRLGFDLAEFLVLAVIDRNLSWESLTPSVLSDGAAPMLPTVVQPSQPSKPTPEQELGLSPKPSTGKKVAGTAMEETIKALQKILTS